MFCRDRDPERELWDGYRQGPEGVVKNFGMNDAYPVSDVDDIVPGLIEGRSTIYFSMGHDDAFDRQVLGWVNSIRQRCVQARSRLVIYQTFHSCFMSIG